jgi:hypothetical protein
MNNEVVALREREFSRGLEKLRAYYWPIAPEDGELERLLRSSSYEYENFRCNLSKFVAEDRPDRLIGLAKHLLKVLDPLPESFSMSHIEEQYRRWINWEDWVGTAWSCRWTPTRSLFRKLGRQIALRYGGDANDYDTLLRFV